MAGGELTIISTRGKCTTAATASRFAKRVAGGWKQCDAVGERPDGIFAFSAALGENTTIYRLGMAVVTAGAAVADGDRVMSDASGRAITYAAGAGRYEAGWAEGAAAALGADLTVNHYPALVG